MRTEAKAEKIAQNAAERAHGKPADYPPGLVALLDSLADELGLDGDAHAMLDGAPLRFMDMLFVFEAGYKESKTKESKTVFQPSVFCDLGTVSAGKELELYTQLLKLQTNVFAMTGQSISLSPASGHVLLRQSFDPAQVTGKSLMALLTALVPLIKDWRGTSGM